MAIEEDAPAGIPEWVVTYGDMMSLLLTFFIMLVSMSELKTEEKIKTAVTALQKQFGKETARSFGPGRVSPSSTTKSQIAFSGNSKKQDVKKGGTKSRSPAGDFNEVRSLRRGEHVTKGGIIFFEDEAATDLNDDQIEDLKQAIADLAGKPQKIEIRGHTPARPATAREGEAQADPWDLAYARCRRTMEQLVALGIDQKRLRVSVAGPNEPGHISDNPRLLKTNSRVEVFMLDELTDDFVGTPEERAERYAPAQL